MQSTTISRRDSISYHMLQIRKIYADINADTANMKCFIGDEDGQSEEGGQYKKCYINNQLAKASFIFYGESGKALYDYYFENGELVFLFLQVDYYDSLLNSRSVKIAKTTKERFYFWNNELIRWIGNDGKIVNQSLYSAKQKEIFDDLKEYLGK